LLYFQLFLHPAKKYALPVHDHPAVHVDGLARDIGGVFAGEIDVGLGELHRLARPAHGGVGAECRDLLGAEGGGDQWRPDGARGHRVHPYLLLGEIEGQGTGEYHHRPLGGGVVEERFVPPISGDAGGIHDGASVPHMGKHRLGHIEHAVYIGAKRALKLVLADVQEAVLGMLLGGVIDEHVDMAEFTHDLPGYVPAEFRVPDVPRAGEAAAALALHDPFGVRCVLVLVEIDDGYVGPLGRKGNGHRPADAAVAPGDDGGLACELIRSHVLGLLLHGSGIHGPLMPGLDVLLLGGDRLGKRIHGVFIHMR